MQIGEFDERLLPRDPMVLGRIRLVDEIEFLQHPLEALVVPDAQVAEELLATVDHLFEDDLEALVAWILVHLHLEAANGGGH